MTENLHALAGASVNVKPGGGGAYTDSAGWFAIDTLQPGHYQLLIRGIGYGPATDSVELSPGIGIEIRSVMMPQALMLDGCGYVQVRVRKPWWKWW